MTKARGACFGPQAVRVAATRVFADIFIIGACGVDSAVGVKALDGGKAELKPTMVSQSSILLVAATAKKLGAVAPFKVADASMINHLVVENGVFDRDFTRAHVQVHVAPAAAPGVA